MDSTTQEPDDYPEPPEPTDADLEMESLIANMPEDEE